MRTISDPSLVTDFGSLTRLKAEAARDPKAQAKTVANQFEGLFIQQMLKAMRAASPGDPLMDGAGVQLFRDMQDQQLANGLAKQGGIGLSDFILRQLTRQGGTFGKILPPKPDGFPSLALKKKREVDAQEEDPATPKQVQEKMEPALLKQEAPVRNIAGEEVRLPAALAFRALPRPTTVKSAPEAGARVRWEEPTQFINDLMPHARAAAARLGVDPKVLIAQSALETGWGKRLPSDASGQPNMNLFGIKAQGGWDGEKTVASTLEYEGGAMVRKNAAFRAYSSIRAAFDDYVNFLQTNPRYSEALKHAGNPERFVQELQKAGYATDPRYAEKILAILRDSPLSEWG
ncbi:MAG: flagellar assembly peptidoglycan hydrolase FlgJ [Gammaproteobacteria bacterium]|nr:flagellar assembly peptidoglycan hydrolase FlgJ [Gammaproteobacteria bacterium]